MTLDGIIEGWLPLVGGISGLALLVYMVLMVYYNRKKDQDIQALRREVAELRGLLLARRSKP